jgi:glutathione S-transferase
MNTPNGQAVQILLEELKAAYGTEWTTTLINIMTNEQKKDVCIISAEGRQRS